MTHAQAFAHGKLFIAGEYAVVEPSRQAILVGLDWGVQVTAQLKLQQQHGQVFSALYGAEGRSWLLTPTGVQSAHMNTQDDVVFAVITLMDTLLSERKLPRHAYTLHISSQLQSADGRKYGLGSSAAVAVACIKAVNSLFALHLSDDAVLKLGILAGLALNPQGSGGDVAASVLGGWVHYASPDRSWIRQQRTVLSLSDLLAQDWPSLLAQKLPAPQSAHLLVGWTGSPANTTALVAEFSQTSQQTALKSKQELLNASDAAVQSLKHSICADNAEHMQTALNQAREAVLTIAQARGRQIETPALFALRQVAQAAGAAAKTSGAGGGDCGIAIVNASDTAQIRTILAGWQTHNIEPLNVKVSV